jgi:serine/threonine-protein kinase RsbW
MSLEVNLSLCLPTDEASVPVVRHICSSALETVGVLDSCLSDISVALTEACTNVLDHVTDAGTAYEVHIGIDDERCIIRVKDTGPGFDHEARTNEPAVDLTAESGRGLGLIRELVDRVKFTSVPEDGMIVHLEKELEFDEDHPVRKRFVAADAAAAAMAPPAG